MIGGCLWQRGKQGAEEREQKGSYGSLQAF